MTGSSSRFVVALLAVPEVSAATLYRYLQRHGLRQGDGRPT